MLVRVDQHRAVLVEEALVALDQDHEIAAVLEGQPGAAIGENVSAHRRRGVERRPHALSGVAIPWPLGFVDVDARRFPQVELGHVGAAAVAARDKRGLCRLELRQRDDDILAATELRRVAPRADEHEVVVHDGIALDAMTFSEEFFLGGARMHEHDIGVASARHIERLSRAKRDDTNLYARLPLIDRQQVAEQTRLFGRCRRCHRDESVLGVRAKNDA